MSDGHSSSTAVPAPSDERPARERKLSQILSGIAADPARERVSVGDLLAAMGDRAFGALMLIFALPNLLPTPPGTSGILGLPLVFLAAQLMLGQRPWLPKAIANRSMPRADFSAVLDRAGPWLARVEKLLRPRLGVLVHPPAEYAIGVACLLLAVILILPIPLGNILPALAICMFSFGLLEKDGLWAIVGAITTIVSVVIVGSVIFALVKSAIFVIQNAL
jgi:hypothetical protein